MTSIEAQIEEALTEVDSVEPGSYQLGTPELPETDALQNLVGMGTAAVPHLLARLGDEQPSKRVAVIVRALSRIGYRPALEDVTKVLARYERRHPKNAWDYAVIGQCRLAIERLRDDRTPAG